MFFEVIPTTVFRADGTLLTYQSDLPLRPGHLVLIPLGRRTTIGIVYRQVPAVSFKTRSILSLVHPTPLPSHLLKAALWLSSYYLSPLPTVAKLLLPAALTPSTAAKLQPIKNLSSAQNLIKRPLQNPQNPARASKITSKTALAANLGPTAPPPKIPLITLNPAQKQALEALKNASKATRLLRGVTGSGKTHIYLQMASEALKAQKSVILLVPEIALTSQIVQVFQQTFGDRITLLHSQQTPATRRRLWLNLLESTTPTVVIGPRSALFAPVHDLGLILIDEAHESSYYQENSPRYSALRLASQIAGTLRIPCVLGSATPNLVDYYLARQNSTLVTLDHKAKAAAKPPVTTIVDLKDRSLFLKNRYFSQPLLAALEHNLTQHHQTLIFHNRRGSAPLTLCNHCGWQALCPNCYLPLTLHTDTYTLVCHLCGHSTPVPSSCPQCHEPDLIHKGFGTKLLESELTRLFPEAKIARFDGDNLKSETLAELYPDVKSGAYQILIGTQALARGLDLPKLATVGIVQADAGLALPDFAAEERTFELLTQVIGRVGRGHLDTASVIVQTYQPDHPVIKAALAADYPAFADYLLKQRRRAGLPPYTYLARLSLTFKTEATTIKHIQSLHQSLQQNPALTLSPPLPAFHERTRRGYTWQLTLKSRSRAALLQALAPLQSLKGCQIALDPPSLL